ncbi:hypothetical protein TNCV_3877911 [Trichonephila clavipes]|uniref:Uncharacterized protein n=1 Tax=Trichonephila clavipes TaxID=2585209 RepID=A0A8X6VR90_TRICX|nr:hypothetical protein TNCV_3877911 [Trichonephila clavipes]
MLSTLKKILEFNYVSFSQIKFDERLEKDGSGSEGGRVGISLSQLTRYVYEKNEYIFRVITDDETWVPPLRQKPGPPQ